MMTQEKATTSISVSHNDLPLSCPTKAQELWNQHPRVFLAFDKNGHALCPYCGNCYQLESNQDSSVP